MANEGQNLLTARKIAEALGVSESQVKKAIKELGLEPATKKGACSYYSAEAMARIKQALEQAK